MKTYQEARTLRVDHLIKKDAKEIVFTMVSCMCDNVSYLKIVQKGDEVEISHYNGHSALAVSNLQLKGDYRTDIECSMRKGDYENLCRVVNSGTSAIAEVKSIALQGTQKSISKETMQKIVEAMDNALSIDHLIREEENACKSLHDFFYEILYGASIEEAIETACGESSKDEYLKVVRS